MVDFLLLHGMCVGSWEFERVIPALQADPRVGKVVAPDMPGRGASGTRDMGSIRLRDYTLTAVEAMRRHDLRDVIVVGHSGGGVYLQAAVAAEPNRVRRMVFLCAAVPQRDHSLLDLSPLPIRLLIRAGLWAMRAGSRGIVPSRRLAPTALCNDLQPEDCQALVRRLVPEPQALLLDRINWPAERVRAPATYIQTTEDRIIPPKDRSWRGARGQTTMIRNVPAVEVVQMTCGHAHPVVYPEQLVKLLLSYAG